MGECVNGWLSVCLDVCVCDEKVADVTKLLTLQCNCLFVTVIVCSGDFCSTSSQRIILTVKGI